MNLNSSTNKIQIQDSKYLPSQIFPVDNKNENTPHSHKGTPMNMTSPPSQTPGTPYTNYQRPSGSTSIFNTGVNSTPISNIPTGSVMVNNSNMTGTNQFSISFSGGNIKPLNTSSLTSATPQHHQQYQQTSYYLQNTHTLGGGAGVGGGGIGGGSGIPSNSIYDLELQPQVQKQQQQPNYITNPMREQFINKQQLPKQDQLIQSSQPTQPLQHQLSQQHIQGSLYVQPFSTTVDTQQQSSSQIGASSLQPQQYQAQSSLPNIQSQQYISNLSFFGVNQQLLEKIDKRWVTVFGFQPQDKDILIEELMNYGNLIEIKTPSQFCNWIQIKYEYENTIFDLLNKNGMVIGNSMIGFALCKDKFKSEYDNQPVFQPNTFKSIEEQYIPSRDEYDPNSTNILNTPSRPSLISKLSEYVFGI